MRNYELRVAGNFLGCFYSRLYVMQKANEHAKRTISPVQVIEYEDGKVNKVYNISK